MTKEQLIRKLTSRKLWVAIAGFVSGVIMSVNADENMAQTVSALILQGASVIGYLLAEGLTDVASLNGDSEIEIEMPEIIEETFVSEGNNR